MKNTYFLLALILFILSSCKEINNETENNAGFGGTAVIKGFVQYQNVLTESIDTAFNVSITLKYQSEKDSMFYNLLSADGVFKIENLNAGKYVLDVKFSVNNPASGTFAYTGDTIITLEVSDFKEIIITGKIDTATITHNYTLQGNLKYVDIISGTNLIADNAQVSLVNLEGITVKSGTTDPSGNFEFTELLHGTYSLKSKYVSVLSTGGVPLQYESINNITLNNNNFITHVEELLQWDSQTTVLKLTLTDSIDNPLPYAKACIYTNLNFMKQNEYSCNGSLRSGQANEYGVIAFSELGSVVHYISATDTIGQVGLFSDSSQATNGVLIENLLNEISIELKELPQ